MNAAAIQATLASLADGHALVKAEMIRAERDIAEARDRHMNLARVEAKMNAVRADLEAQLSALQVEKGRAQ